MLLPAVLVLCGGCSDDEEPSGVTTETVTVESTSTVVPAPETTVTDATTTTTTTLPDPGEGMVWYGELRVPEVLDGFAFGPLWLDGQGLFAGIADTSESRRQGLMFIEDMGDLDGMLFVFEQDSSGGFWMKNTLIPLDIAFFDVEGKFVDGFRMEPCVTENCPSYVPGGPYRFALEMAAGDMPQAPSVLSLMKPE